MWNEISENELKGSENNLEFKFRKYWMTKDKTLCRIMLK